MQNASNRVFAAFAGLALSALATAASALPTVGAPAPQFSATTTDGKAIKLSDYAGKLVVIEWTNKDCPFVGKHYGTGNMQATQAAIEAQGGVWLSVISSAPGKEGFVDASAANAHAQEVGAHVDGIVLDPSGSLGHLYGATATPGMFVIDAKQTVRYIGAIDDRPSANPTSVKGATNYVLAAADAIRAGRAVNVTETAPYGCSVKY